MKSLQNSKALSLTFSLVLSIALTGGYVSGKPSVLPQEEEMAVVADQYEYTPATGWAVGEGHVEITYGDLVLTADKVRVNPQTKDVEAQGNVVLTDGTTSWSGPEIRGNFGTNAFSFGVCRIVSGSWFARGHDGKRYPDGRVTLEKGVLTTCDLEKPHYRVESKKVIYYPNGKFRAQNAIVKLGEVPVFYWPIIMGDTSGATGDIELRPGYSSDWGAFLVIGRGWRLGKAGDTRFHVDITSKRGVGIGNETSYRTERTETELNLYGIDDQDTPETQPGYNGRFETEDLRYRANIYHRFDLNEATSLRLNVDKLSDIDMLEDWFEEEYDANPQPATYAHFSYERENLALAVQARPRVNDFYSVVESLPEVTLDAPRQTLRKAGFFYESHTSAGHYEMKWRDFDLGRVGLNDPEDYEAWRVDTTHFLYRPFRLANAVQVIPRAGIRLTHYTDSSDASISGRRLMDMIEVDDPDNPFSTVNVTNYDDNGGGLTRLAAEAGVEVTSKLYRVWPDFRNGRFNIDGLRHVLNPYLNYTFIPDPTEDRENIYFFDAADRLLEQNFVRVGVNQRLQTRRKGQIYTLARMQTYADFHFSTKGDGDHDAPGNLGNRIEFSPKETLSFWNTVVADMGSSEITRAELGCRLGRPETLEATLSYVMRADYYSRPAYSMGSSLLDFAGDQSLIDRHYEETRSVVGQLRFAITEKMTGRIRLEYDLDEMELVQQLYEITRDLHCWMGSLQFQEEDGDFEVLLVFYLKALPNVRLGAGI